MACSYFILSLHHGWTFSPHQSFRGICPHLYLFFQLQWFHGLSGGIVFTIMPIIIFIFLRRFVSDANWQSFRWWTLILGIIEAFGVVVFTYVSKIPLEQNAYINYFGLFQRIALIPFMVWVFLFGIEMLRRQK